LAPSADAVVALASSRRAWSHAAVRRDPAAIALVLKHQRTGFPPGSLELTPADRADLLRAIGRRLRSAPAGLPTDPTAGPASEKTARTARKLADPAVRDAAFVVAKLAFLGRWACGTSTLASATRIIRRWQLPEWVVAAVTALPYAPATARRLGADPKVVAAVRAAIFLTAPELIPGLNESTLRDIKPAGKPLSRASTGSPIPYRNPYRVPLLKTLLAIAEQNFRRSHAAMARRLEAEVDRLHAALAEQQRSEHERLHERKLNALAELAAGAGHEINTPLAIISGQAQLLLQRSGEADWVRPLQTIVAQTRRVHEILTDMMAFARPTKPQPQVFDLSIVVQEAANAAREAAADRGVRIEVDVPAAFVAYADPRQARTILNNLVRNALEAVAPGGWLKFVGDDADDGRLRVSLIDSAGGPDPAIIEHLFDPFFSGRPAGRGRGLGLPTAWRLAREQGGDVRFEPLADGAARFSLLLPRAESFPAGRLSA
jgi:signal transduction histidine kinase